MTASPARTQRHEDLVLFLDGDAYAYAWTPNITDPENRIEIDLLPDLAVTCWLGLGRPHEPPTGHADTNPTLIVRIDLGANGSAKLAGEEISQESIATLAATGLIESIRLGMAADGASPAPRP